MSAFLPVYFPALSFFQTGVGGRPNKRGCRLKKGSAVQRLIKTHSPAQAMTGDQRTSLAIISRL